MQYLVLKNFFFLQQGEGGGVGSGKYFLPFIFKNNCADASLLSRNDCVVVLILQSNVWEKRMTINLQ